MARKTSRDDCRLGFRITETGVTARSQPRQIKEPAKSAAAIHFGLFRSCGNSIQFDCGPSAIPVDRSRYFVNAQICAPTKAFCCARFLEKNGCYGLKFGFAARRSKAVERTAYLPIKVRTKSFDTVVLAQEPIRNIRRPSRAPPCLYQASLPGLFDFNSQATSMKMVGHKGPVGVPPAGPLPRLNRRRSNDIYIIEARLLLCCQLSTHAYKVSCRRVLRNSTQVPHRCTRGQCNETQMFPLLSPRTETRMARLLIADDFVPLRSSLKKYFEAKGIGTCLEAENGRDALRLAERLRPGLGHPRILHARDE
jgi:hypothetical protein